MTITDMLIVLLLLNCGALFALAIYARQEHERAERVCIQAEENWAWSELHRSAADDAQRELLALEERHITLQLLHADAQRRLIARNFIVEYRRKHVKLISTN